MMDLKAVSNIAQQKSKEKIYRPQAWQWDPLLAFTSNQIKITSKAKK